MTFMNGHPKIQQKWIVLTAQGGWGLQHRAAWLCVTQAPASTPIDGIVKQPRDLFSMC